MVRPRVTRIMQAAVWIRQFGSLIAPGQCPYCKGEIAQIGCEFDHIVPLARGGKHVATNLQAVCAVCNRSKNDRPAEQVERELGLSQTKSDMEETDNLEKSISATNASLEEKPVKKPGKLCAAITKSGSPCKLSVCLYSQRYCISHYEHYGTLDVTPVDDNDEPGIAPVT